MEQVHHYALDCCDVGFDAALGNTAEVTVSMGPVVLLATQRGKAYGACGSACSTVQRSSLSWSRMQRSMISSMDLKRTDTFLALTSTGAHWSRPRAQNTSEERSRKAER